MEQSNFGKFGNNYKNNPCVRDCAGRNESCHSTCERYAEWRKAVDEEREKRYSERKNGQKLDEIAYARAVRTKKRMNKR